MWLALYLLTCNIRLIYEILPVTIYCFQVSWLKDMIDFRSFD